MRELRAVLAMVRIGRTTVAQSGLNKLLGPP